MSDSPRRKRRSASPSRIELRRERYHERDYYERSAVRERDIDRERRRSDDGRESRWKHKDLQSNGRNRYRSRSSSGDRHRYRRSEHHDSDRRIRKEPVYDDDDYKRSRRRRRDSHSFSPKPRRHKHSPSPSPSSSSSPPSRQSKQLLPPRPPERSKVPLPSQVDAFKGHPSSSDLTTTNPPPTSEKLKPNFAPSGKLAAETNTVAGTSIVLKYNEPPESRKPPTSQPWRLYVFKGSGTDPLDTIELSTRSCWLFGRERAVVDFPVEHPSCSKQHAVLQFRFLEKKNEFGDREAGVRPYLIDLESANGTKVNGDRVPERRFVEVRSGDMLGFGDSTREYVLMLPPGGSSNEVKRRL